MARVQTDWVRGTGTGPAVLPSGRNDQLVIVCLLYDVSEMKAIRLIGWSEQRRVQQQALVVAVVEVRGVVQQRRSRQALLDRCETSSSAEMCSEKPSRC